MNNVFTYDIRILHIIGEMFRRLIYASSPQCMLLLSPTEFKQDSNTVLAVYTEGGKGLIAGGQMSTKYSMAF